ncbi:MAG: tetratricopeptide repeat protein [Candidatus Omnitrophica bacterium]|nr:tetratricopeptide repeat protein [Candidatus Omnitrophota bacterium]
MLLTGGAAKPGQLLLNEAKFYRAEGHQYQSEGNLVAAEASYRKAIIAHPLYAEAYNDLGVILESRNKLADAENSYKTALRINPGLAAAHSNLALLYEKQGKVKEAGEHWGNRVKLGSAGDPWTEQAREKLLQYNMPVPLTPEQMKVKRADEIKRALKDGQLHMRAKRWDRAAKEFQRVLELDPKNSKAAAHLKEVLTHWKKEKGLKPDPQREAERAYEAGQVYLKGGRLDWAEQEFKNALKIDPKHKGAARGLSDVQKARKILAEKGISADKGPDRDVLMAAMDAALLMQGATGQADQAKRWAEEAARKAGEAQKRLAAARMAAEEADRLAAIRKMEYEKWKSELDRRAAALREAEESARKATDRLAEETKKTEALHQVEAAQKQAEEAMQQAEQARQQAQAAMQMAEETKKQELAKEAQAAMQRAMEAKQLSEQASQEAQVLRRQLGTSVPEAKKPAQSTESSRRERWEAPERKSAPEPKKEPVKAVSPKEEEPSAAVSTDAKALAEQMERDKTKNRLQTIREIYQRGVTAMRQGRYEEAISHFQQVLELDPNHPEAKQGLKRAEIALSKSTK